MSIRESGKIWDLTDEDFFEGFGLKKVSLYGQTLYEHQDGTYWRIDLGKSFVAVEYADNKEYAKGAFDDAEFFDIEEGMTREDVLKMVRDAMPGLL